MTHGRTSCGLSPVRCSPLIALLADPTDHVRFSKPTIDVGEFVVFERRNRFMEILLVLGVLIGVVMGLTGAGGGVLAVPALIVGIGWTMQEAAPVALIAVAGGSALGAIEGFRKGLVRYRAAVFMVLFGLPMTPIGLYVANRLSQQWLQLIFAGVTLIVAVRLILRTLSSRAAVVERKFAQINPETGRFRWSLTTGSLFACVGALAGFMAGLLGVGGGFVIVPALRRFTNASMHSVVATSLMVIALVGSGAVVASLMRGAELPVPATPLFALATAVGMGVGRIVSPRLSENAIQRGFAVVLLATAVNLVVKSIIGG